MKFKNLNIKAVSLSLSKAGLLNKRNSLKPATPSTGLRQAQADSKIT